MVCQQCGRETLDRKKEERKFPSIIRFAGGLLVVSSLIIFAICSLGFMTFLTPKYLASDDNYKSMIENAEFEMMNEIKKVDVLESKVHFENEFKNMIQNEEQISENMLKKFPLNIQDKLKEHFDKLSKLKNEEISQLEAAASATRKGIRRLLLLSICSLFILGLGLLLLRSKKNIYTCDNCAALLL